MAVRQVVHFPHPALKTETALVSAIDDEVRSLIADLLDTMRATDHCVGLAANQLGVTLRVAVVDVTGHRQARSCAGEVVLVNPVIVEAHEPVSAREGCMSVPDLTGDVARATRVVVQSLDAEGGEQVIEADAFEARAFLHEIDHLDGRLFLDRVESHAAVFRRRTFR